MVNRSITTGWVPIFREISNKLLKYKNDRKPLVKEIHKILATLQKEGIGISLSQDIFSDRSEGKLKDICPFTILGIMNRGLKNRNKTAFLHKLADFLEVKEGVSEFHFSGERKTDTDAIPFVNNQKFWFFPYESEREKNDINKLWNMFEIAINYADGKSEHLREDFIKVFDSIIPEPRKGGVKHTKLKKLSMGLYWIRPYSYPTFAGGVEEKQTLYSWLDKMNISYLDKIDFADKKFDNINGDDYLKIMDFLQIYFNNPDSQFNDFIELSYAAYHPETISQEYSIATTEKNTGTKNQPLNQILYGPPGTGKTYETKSLAVEIITGEKLSSRDQLNSCYNSLVEDGRIQFITFHQSYGYEDFVEGIKPKLDKLEGGDIQYEIKDGIFKQLCEESSDRKNLTMDSTMIVPSAKLDARQEITLGPNEYKGRKVWQLRIETHGFLNETSIAVDGFEWFNNYDLESAVNNNKENIPEFKKILDKEMLEQIEKGKSPETFLGVTLKDRIKNNMKNFCLEIKDRDLVMIYQLPKGGKKTNQIIAVVEIIGGYKYKKVGGYRHTRVVKCLWRKGDDELPIDIRDINNNGVLGERTLLLAKKMKPEALIEKINQHIGVAQEESPYVSNADHLYPQSRFVLIIDEINRGNISKILGELITLLEEDKRLGGDEELKVTLPYSNKKFGVPSNLYIIGTMNTADRSIAFLDTALRRRFNFIEMMPKYKEDNGDNLFPIIKTSAGVIDISKMLEQINTKICKELDRDHQIGHSYFISKNHNEYEDIKWLKRIFTSKICPLLDEYFYERRDKIKEVLNDCELIDDINDNEDWEWTGAEAFSKPVNYIKIYKDK